MRHLLAGVAFSLAAATLATPASAATTVFAGVLGPEVAGATGTGLVKLTFDTTAHTLGVQVEWAGLSAGTTVAHVHCCVAPPGTVGVAVTPGTLPGFPVGVTAGSYSALIDLTLNGSYTAAFLTGSGGTAAGAEAALLAGLQAGQAYFNIHSTRFPSGEIRSFPAPVPEPATWGLMIAGFGVIGGAMRARRRVVTRFEAGA